MKLLLNKLSSICMVFTMSVLGIILADFAAGHYSSSLSGQALLIMLGFITVLYLIPSLMNQIPFRREIFYQISTALIQYAAFLVYLVCWFRYQHLVNLTGWLLKNTVLYAIIYFLISLYYRKKSQLQAEEINRLLDRQK